MLRRLFKYLLGFCLLGILFLILFIKLVSWGVFGPIPSRSDLEDIQNADASLIYSADQQLIGQIYIQNRTTISFEKLPKDLINALIATEDFRFFEHDGVDNRSLVRVLFKSILLQDASSGGGSTLSQQLAKNLFGRVSFGFMSMPVNKLKEIILATRIEEIYSKNQIIELYLNTVPFSENTYGIEAASRRFFAKSASKLKIEESAVLVGILKANTFYNPRVNPENALKRRNVVISQMEKYDYLNRAKADSLKALSLNLNYTNLVTNGKAPYFIYNVKKRAAEILKEIYPDEDKRPSLSKDGLLIRTTLDYAIQRNAEKSVDANLRNLQRVYKKQWGENGPWQSEELVQGEYTKLSKRNSNIGELDEVQERLISDGFQDTVMSISLRDSIEHYQSLLHASFVALEPQYGAVKAWVGGRDFYYLPYDLVYAKRQMASTVKPFIMATALENGFDPCDYYENEQRVYEDYDNWSPRNYSNKYGGLYTMEGALKLSLNTISVQIASKLGLDKLSLMLRDLGFSNVRGSEPSLALGAASVSLFELASAYSSFANGGLITDPYMIESIEDKNGVVLYRKEKELGKRILEKETTEYINQMLSSVVDNGTAQSIRTKYEYHGQLAGKTGTSQNYSDAWFLAYNGSLVMGTWVGASSPKVHFKSGRPGSGSQAALPIIGSFLKYNSTSSSLRKRYSKGLEISDSVKSTLADCPDFKEESSLDVIKDFLIKEEGENSENEGGFFKSLFKGK